ncbi:2705_t:CDS:2 [Funneliformis geosporum]|nr:2705_t:CDS:2 [Funneliformis geosporum]
MNEIVKQIKSKLNLSNQIDEENLINSNENSIRESEIDIKDDFGFKCKCEGDWCDCDTIQFLKENNLIYESQLKTKHYWGNLEWIPFDSLINGKLIGEGGVASNYTATWLDGKPRGTIKKKPSPITVALKKIKNSNNVIEAFISELKIQHKCDSPDVLFLKIYGITKEPITENFMMVLEYAEYGNLRSYLKNFNLKWESKLKLLNKISNDLSEIHKLNFVHKNLHSGNILLSGAGHFGPKITDIGLSQLINDSSSSTSTNVFGVLPYIASELLDKKPFSFASDVYSFGIIMVEVSTGKLPYGDVPHDERLALAICNGLRPRVTKGTPKSFIDLVDKCLDADPEKRPSTQDLSKVINGWYMQLLCKEESGTAKEFLNSDEIDPQESSETKIHPQAIYTSRLLNFNNLPKPTNSTGVQFEGSEVPESQLTDLLISI